MNHSIRQRERPGPQSGVALIIVLSLLALMMVLGVAFAIFMRTERLAAGSYLGDVTARQLLHSAVSRAAMDTEFFMATNSRVYPEWDAIESISTNDWSDPDWNANPGYRGYLPHSVWRKDAFGADSYVPNPPRYPHPIFLAVYTNAWRNWRVATPTNPPFADVLTGEASDFVPFGAFYPDGTNRGSSTDLFVPGAVLGSVAGGTLLNLTRGYVGLIESNYWDGANSIVVAKMLDAAGNQVAWQDFDTFRILLPEWCKLEYTNFPFNLRVAYVVVNASGLPDVNASGGQLRGSGTNVQEIQLEAFPEVEDEEQLGAYRPQLYRFETVQELTRLAGPASGFRQGRRPTHFTTWSRQPQGYLSAGTIATPVTITGDVSSLSTATRHTAIVSALQSGFKMSVRDAEVLYTNLLDYVDSDSQPRDFGGPFVEAVPMINEVYVTNQITYRVDGTFDVRPRVYFEVYYPFVKPSPYTFDLHYRISFVNNGGIPDFVPTDVPEQVLATGYNRNIDTNRYIRLTSIPISKAGNYAPYVGSGQQPNFQIRVQAWVTTGAPPVIVDAAPYPTNVNAFVFGTSPALNLPAALANVIATEQHDAECRDPRFNWSVTDTGLMQQWRIRSGTGSSNTLGRINGFAQEWIDQGLSDSSTDMYVADGPVQSAAELSFLVRGLRKPGAAEYSFWRTCRLFSKSFGISAALEPTANNLDPMLDVFTADAAPTTRGKINPNTRLRDVVVAVFTNMPLDAYPQQVSPPIMTAAQVAEVADWWVTNAAAGSVTNLSHLGTLTNMLNLGTLSNLSLFQKESLIRNTANLVSPRQNHFYVFIHAQVTRDIPMSQPSVLAGAQAVAEIWRDPYPEGGRSRMQLRFMKSLRSSAW